MSVFSIFKRGLEKSSTRLRRSFASLVGAEKSWNDAVFDELLEHLVLADFGVPGATKVVESIRDEYELGHISSSDDVYRCAERAVAEILSRNQRGMTEAPAGTPTVILFVGVNGAGKTTTIGKLACRLHQAGKSVMLAASDTYRAAAQEQLKLWSEKSSSLLVMSQTGADPASVAFDALKSAAAKKTDYLLIDTAGRQQTHKGLMEELAKLRRTAAKVLPGAPHETILVVDASQGSNALSQAKGFSASAAITGLIVTKLDGSGKGGMAVSLHQEFGLPIFFAGLGEQPDDLREFDPEAYAAALFDGGEGE